MLLGVTLPSGPLALEPQALTALAAHAESCGLDSIWVADHVVLPKTYSEAYPYTREEGVTLPALYPFLDPLITLAGAAARTSKILLCAGIYILPLRHPVSAAKQLATLDLMSGGRLRLGIGLGWIREEYEALGVPWDKRGRILDEQIALMRTLWRDENPTFEGEFWRINDIGFEPKPKAKTIPLLIGGLNDAARRRAARAGDGWHLIDVEPGAAADMIADLREDCARARRDPASVPVSIYLSYFGDRTPGGHVQFPLQIPQESIPGKLRAYKAAGVNHIALAPRGLSSMNAYHATIETIAQQYLPEIAR